MTEKRKKTDIGLVKEQVEMLLTNPMAQKELCALLMKHFDCAENTIKNRLKTLIDTKEVMHNAEGQSCRLMSSWDNGKSTMYYLSPELPTFPELDS